MPSDRCDVVVVGAGIVGLATAHRLLEARPELTVALLEREPAVGGHQSSHNSGVLHAGLYYAPGSLKAALCTEGKAAMEAFARERDISFVRNGKLVVAVESSELGRFEDLWQRVVANGVEGAVRLGPDELREVEPHVAGLAAIHSPTTGVIDFGEVCRVLADELSSRGVRIHLRTQVVAIEERADRAVVRVDGPSGEQEIAAAVVVTCAGTQSDRVAALSHGPDDERVVPFRGSWVELTGPSADLVRANIYPVPDPSLPFLGVHATRRIDGRVMAGPNAVLSLTRDSYRSRYAVTGRDVAATVGFGGFWRLARRNVRNGAREVWHDLRIRAYVAELRRYLPEVRDQDVVRGPWGIRAQALRRDGSMVDDFSLDHSDRVVHVRNAPSPAATSSLAIGRVIAQDVTARLD